MVSLTIHIQHEQPEDEKAANWLPNKDWRSSLPPPQLRGYLVKDRQSRKEPMSKPEPLLYGHYYHIYNRGNSGEILFREERSESPKEWRFAHDTELLRIVRKVIKEHWEGKDPARAPSKEWMVSHLQSAYKLSKGAAEAIDQVTRHDSRSRTKQTK